MQRRIAEWVIGLHGRQPITAVAYDKREAALVVHHLEQAGITCIPTAQGFGVSPGCVELQRRLVDGSISIVANPVMRSHAENVEVKTGDRGDIYPVKPGHKAQGGNGSKGRRGVKIDLISALVTAMTEVQRRAVAPAGKQWDGGVWVL